MAALQITIPGIFEDVFCYMGQVIALSSGGLVMSVSLEHELDIVFKGRIPAMWEFFFVHNEWLKERRLARFQQIDGIRNGLQAAAKQEPVLVIEPHWRKTEIAARAIAGSILDLQVYRRRLYISTTQGLYDADVDIEYGDLDILEVQRRLDARCLATSVKYGTVAASCGSEGLFAAFDDFGQLDSDNSHGSLRSMTPKSLRSSWLGYSLANYSTAVDTQFLSGHKKVLRRSDGIDEQNSTLVTDLTEDTGSTHTLAMDASHADFVFNSRDLFFVQTRARYALYHRRHRLGRLVGKQVPAGAGRVGQALSAHTFDNGVIVESYDHVYLIRPNGVDRIFDGPALKVRTFPSGINCKNLVAVIDEHALHLISPMP